MVMENAFSFRVLAFSDSCKNIYFEKDWQPEMHSSYSLSLLNSFYSDLTDTPSLMLTALPS
jgi:hypothetical protein